MIESIRRKSTLTTMKINVVLIFEGHWSTIMILEDHITEHTEQSYFLIHHISEKMQHAIQMGS